MTTYHLRGTDGTEVFTGTIQPPPGGGSQPPIPFVQDADPGAVGAGAIWVDTSTDPPVEKIRNTADDDWIAVGSGSQPGYTPVAITVLDSPFAAAKGQLVLTDAANGDVEIDLPSAPTAGDQIAVWLSTDPAGSLVTITPAGGLTVNGQASVVLSSAYAAAVLVFDGVSDWSLLNGLPDWFQVGTADPITANVVPVLASGGLYLDQNSGALYVSQNIGIGPGGGPNWLPVAGNTDVGQGYGFSTTFSGGALFARDLTSVAAMHAEWAAALVAGGGSFWQIQLTDDSGQVPNIVLSPGQFAVNPDANDPAFTTPPFRLLSSGDGVLKAFLQSLPTSDPGVSGQLWVDAAAGHALKVSP